MLEPVRWFRAQGTDIPLTPGPDGIPETVIFPGVGADPALDEMRLSYFAPLSRYGLQLEDGRVGHRP